MKKEKRGRTCRLKRTPLERGGKREEEHDRSWSGRQGRDELFRRRKKEVTGSKWTVKYTVASKKKW
jgi:hypothetical protein